MNEFNNQEIVTQFIEKIYNSGQLNYINKLVHPDFKFHGLKNVDSIEDLKLSFAYLLINWNSIFRELTFSIEEIESEGDYIEVTLRKLGQFKTPYPNRSMNAFDCMMTIKEKYLVENGKIKERWTSTASAQQSQEPESDFTSKKSDYSKM